MRLSLPIVLVVTSTLVLAGCGDSGSPEEGATSSAAPTTAAPSEPPDPSAEPSAEPGVTPEPTEQTTEPPASPVTDLPASVLLPAESLFPEGEIRTEGEGVVDWVFPVPCAVGGPGAAVAMRSVAQGDGTFEVPVGHHQVAVFEDVDAAVAEADRIAAALDACQGTGSDGQSSSIVEPVAVGAQGIGFVVDYYGALQANGDEGTLGYYTAVTRRGNAVTLVSSEGGESSIAASRERVAGELGAAWDQLCAYESTGC